MNKFFSRKCLPTSQPASQTTNNKSHSDQKPLKKPNKTRQSVQIKTSGKLAFPLCIHRFGLFKIGRLFILVKLGGCWTDILLARRVDLLPLQGKFAAWEFGIPIVIPELAEANFRTMLIRLKIKKMSTIENLTGTVPVACTPTV